MVTPLSNEREKAQHWSGLLRLTHTQIPFWEQANLFLGITTLCHSGDEIVVFFGVFIRRFGREWDNRQEIFSIWEHFFLNDGAHFLVRLPAGVVAIVVSASTQYKVYDLVAEIFWITNAADFSIFSNSSLIETRSRISPVSGSRYSWSCIQKSA